MNILTIFCTVAYIIHGHTLDGVVRFVKPMLKQSGTDVWDVGIHEDSRPTLIKVKTLFSQTIFSISLLTE